VWLRQGLHDAADLVQPEVERRLSEARRRVRRRRLVVRVGAPLVAAATAVALVVTVPIVVHAPRSSGPQRPALVAPGTYQNIAGQYTAVVSDANPEFNGRVVLVVWSHGSVVAYPGDEIRHAGVFNLRDDTFVTDLFASECKGSVATYFWRITPPTHTRNFAVPGWTSTGPDADPRPLLPETDGRQLIFTPVQDSCAFRSAVMTSQPWLWFHFVGPYGSGGIFGG
jgi:hypothetical protein